MKILFTADHHIRLGQKNVPRQWARDRYNLFFEKVNQIEKHCDLHIMGGDIFDRTPSLEELEVYFDWVSKATIPTIIYPGNHEAETRKESFFNKLSFVTKSINPLVTVVTEISSSTDLGFSDTEFYVVPYSYIKKKSTWDDLPNVPVFTHVRGEIPPHVKPEIDLSWLDKFPVVFAGDLHSHQNTQGLLCYPGSPMTTSFHRSLSTNTNGYIVIDTDDWSWKWSDFDLPQLIRKTVSTKEEIIPTERHHTIYELEGTLDSVSGKVDNELLDKKIVKRSSDVALMLTEEMSEEEELKEYLLYVLELEDIDEVMTAYHEYS